MKPDQIIRSRRRTVAIVITTDGGLLVRAPLHASDAEILALIKEKESWIRSKQALVKEKNSTYQPKQYIPGERFLYLGEHFPLRIVPVQRRSLILDYGYFQLRKASLGRAEQIFARWYREQARIIFTERMTTYSMKAGVSYKSIRITGARTRWGSCSSNGSINFSWRLVMAPLDVIDYVIVHELTHLKVPNHSHKFWQEVSELMPDFGIQRKWLKENGHQFRL